MRTISKTLLALPVLTGLSLLAGGLRVEVGNPAANLEANAKQAVLVARITACQSPEKTSIAATAEGVVDGSRRTIPLRVIPLATPGTFAVTREWPADGKWAVKLVATNPDYKDYATGVLARMEESGFDWAGVKHFYHAPTPGEVDAALGSPSPVVARR
jgi:hypothetical protein